MDSKILQLFLIVILVLLNGFFVAAEFGLVKIRASRIHELVAKGNRRAKLAHMVIQHLDAYLSACQLGITLASLGLGWVGEPAIAQLIEQPLHALGLEDAVRTIAFVVAFVVVTFLHIVVGELAPKSFAIHRAETTVLIAAPPLLVFHKVMFPFIWVLNATANRLLRMVGIQPATEGEHAHTEDEIRILMTQSHRKGLIDNTEMALFDNIFEFSDRIAREIMVPRTDMATIDITDSSDVMLRKIEETQHTRYPVALGDKDHIIGYIHVKDLYVNQHLEGLSPHKVLRKVTTVAEAAPIHAVLRLMQKHRTQIAIVVDEFGGTAGLITMEDVIEELVGEIQDEFDSDELAPITETAQGYLVSGRVLVDEINSLLNIQLGELDVDTIGGWMFSLMNKIPTEGDVIKQSGYVFSVAKTAQNRIERVRIYPDKPDKEESEGVSQ